MKNNYHTMFAYKQKVRITRGFFIGREGIIMDYSPHVPSGLVEDCIRRLDHERPGVYAVKLGIFKTVLAQEIALEAI